VVRGAPRGVVLGGHKIFSPLGRILAIDRLHMLQINAYCRVEKNRTADVAAASARRDHRKSKFEVSQA
jgi:hypothetical protein